MITATNVKGYSTSSDAGNGAIIVTIPDAPTNLNEILSLKSLTSSSI